MSLRNQINDNMKAALKGGEKARLGTLRLVLAALKQKEIDERIILDDADVVAVIEKMIKQRKDSISQYEAAKRLDLADAERFELEVLVTYMPQSMDSDELAAIIAAAVTESGAKGPADMGKVMGLVKPKVAGRADMGEVSRLIKARLAAA